MADVEKIWHTAGRGVIRGGELPLAKGVYESNPSQPISGVLPWLQVKPWLPLKVSSNPKVR